MACTPPALVRLMQKETTDLNNLRYLVSTCLRQYYEILFCVANMESIVWILSHDGVCSQECIRKEG